MSNALKLEREFKFIKQRDLKSCGPIAMLNLFIAHGYNYTYEDLKWMSPLVDCDFDGTEVHEKSEFREMLKCNFNFRHFNTRKTSKTLCIAHTFKDKVFLANHRISKDDRHIFLVVGFEDNLFNCVNYRNYESISKLSWNQLSADRTLEVWLID